MVQIKSLNNIDKDKLKSLFKKRGHGILNPNFLEQVKRILEGKHQGMEVHQCRCGELMIFSETYAESLRIKYKTDEIPCKVCGDREENIFSLHIFKRFEDITHFLDERYIFTTKQAAMLKPEDADALGKMALGLFPTNTHAEMLVGYFDFMKALSWHLSLRIFKTNNIVKRLFERARKKNKEEFERLYTTLLDWEESHKAEINIFSKQNIMSILRSKNSSRSLEEDLVEMEKIDLKTARIQLELSTYQDTAEIKIYLDILANILNILHGEKISADPFKAVRLSPLKNGGNFRKVTSLADKIEYLQDKLPFKIKYAYNTHLRNAIAHNEYEILKERRIVLTRYSETLTFTEFRKVFRALSNLHHSINNYLVDYHIEKIRKTVRNQGIGALIMGYTNFFEEQGKLHPKFPCDAQLNIYQYWDFATFNEREHVFPKFEIQFEEKNQIMIIDFGENGALYHFPKAPELIEWLEQINLTCRLHITLYTIAPILPIFAQEAIIRVPVGKIMDIYLLSVAEKTMSMPPELLNNAVKFLIE